MVIEKSKANDNARICGKSCYADLQTRSKPGQRCKQRENPRTKFCNFFKIKNLTNQIRAIFPLSYVYTRKHCLEVS